VLYLIGLGLNDEKDISQKGLELAREAELAYMESYTNLWHGDMKKLEKLIGKPVKLLGRADVEESGELLDKAKKNKVCLLIPGDPLAATTHIEMFIQAKKAGIRCEVVHAGSIFTAVAETGLQLYKFGEAITIPFPEGKWQPVGWYSKIVRNHESGLHTLVLLDIKNDKKESKAMSISEALDIIKELDKKKLLEKPVVACSRLGSEKQKIAYGMESELKKKLGKDDTPAVLIIPGVLHFKEEECLELYWIGKKPMKHEAEEETDNEPEKNEESDDTEKEESGEDGTGTEERDEEMAAAD